MQQKLVVVTFLCALLATPLSANSILLNGNFEAGLANWTSVASGGGHWVAAGAGNTPLSGHASVGPASGTEYAVSDQTSPAAESLSQQFTVGAGDTVTVSFDMFVNNWSPSTIDGGTLSTGNSNQYGRVDILTGSAGPFDLGANVVENLYDGGGAGVSGAPYGYTHYSFDISAAIAAGGTFQIRFAEADTQYFFNMGVDNVVMDDTSSVPEPATILLLGSALSGFAALRRRITK